VSKSAKGCEQRAFLQVWEAVLPCEEEIMIVRIAAVVTVLASFVALGMPLNGPGAFQPTTAAAAPAATWSNGLEFSTSVDSNGRPENPRVEFGSGTDVVWVSFEFRDHDPGAVVSYLGRANGDDFKDGKLACCNAREGRFAFPFTRRGGDGDLPGAAYDIRIYVNGAEVAQGGFGVNGRGGLDNDGQDLGNDND
jgi:hypothetical protein